MRKFVVILFLIAAVHARALITNNLVADWQGGVGVTVSGGQISQWNDQHQLLNNDGLGPHNLTQSTSTLQPYDVRDAHGNRGVLFPWAASSGHPNDYFNIPSSLTGLSSTNFTVYAVATGPSDQERSETLLLFSGFTTGWLRFFLAGTYPANYPASLSVGNQQSTVYPPLNPAVLVGSGDPFRTTFRWNNVIQTNAAQPIATGTSGGTVGVNNSAISAGGEYGYSGIMYRILVYKRAHTQVEMDAQVSELASLYGVMTNYTKQAVCRGDSIVEGVASTMLQSFPFQLWQRYPEILWRNQGIGSKLIGTNGGANDTMYAVDGNFVDPLYDESLQQNWLLFFGGPNDIANGISATSTYGRLTNYVAARKAACGWNVVVCTVQARNDSSLILSNAIYNACIRTNAGGWDAYVDPGLNSPIETRLNNPLDTNYFSPDGLHLNNAGYGVMADHFGQIVNVPHRTTGYFGP
jgi:lysophospholipase L1-like esterase